MRRLMIRLLRPVIVPLVIEAMNERDRTNYKTLVSHMVDAINVNNELGGKVGFGFENPPTGGVGRL